MGQIVQYPPTGQKPKEKVLKWIDTTDPSKNDTNKNDLTSGLNAGGPTASTPKKP